MRPFWTRERCSNVLKLRIVLSKIDADFGPML